MTKQFRIEGNDHDWIDMECAQSTKLRPALFEEVVGMCVGCFFRRGTIVQFFFRTAASDAVVFDAGELSHLARDGAEVLERKIETNVAIKFAIGGITGITFVRAPDLPARVPVAGESSRAGRRVTGRIDRAARLP